MSCSYGEGFDQGRLRHGTQRRERDEAPWRPAKRYWRRFPGMASYYGARRQAVSPSAWPTVESALMSSPQMQWMSKRLRFARATAERDANRAFVQALRPSHLARRRWLDSLGSRASLCAPTNPT